jgi:excisionase family DNA binding protein
MTIEPMYLTIDGVTDATTISRSEIYRAMGSGKLPFHIIAGRRRIKMADLKVYLSRGG